MIPLIVEEMSGVYSIAALIVTVVFVSSSSK